MVRGLTASTLGVESIPYTVTRQVDIRAQIGLSDNQGAGVGWESHDACEASDCSDEGNESV